MNEKKWSGVWWVYSEDNQDSVRVPGTLSFDEDGDLELMLTPAPSEPSLDCFWNKNYIIWGHGSTGEKITLLNAYVQRTVGSRVERLLANYALVGAHVPSFKTPFIQKTVVKYPYLKDFLFVQHVKLREENGITAFQLETPSQRELRISLEDGIEWILLGYYQWQTKFRYSEINIKQDTNFIIETNEAKSINFFLKQIREFSDFLSVAFQGKQSPNEISFYIDCNNICPKFELYYNSNTASKFRCHLIGDSVPIQRMPDIIRNWHNNYNEVAPIYRYLEKSSLDHKGIGGIPEFLLVEFAIEGYFKRFHNKLKTNGKDIQKCGDELKALLDYYSDVDLIKNLKLNINVVVETRNAYTHLYPDKEKNDYVMQNAHQLWVTTEKLRILLLCCLLDNMGFTIKEIDTNFKTAPIINPEQYQNKYLFE